MRDRQVREKVDGYRFAFVPRPLELPGRPELNHFPLNVLFAAYQVQEKDEILEGSAAYEPDLPTYTKEGDVAQMTYRNVYGGDCYLVISYDEQKKMRYGEKFLNGKSVGAAFGQDNWKAFFFHLTILGLAKGERCKFQTYRRGKLVSTGR